MPKLAIIGQMHFAPGRREQALPLLMAHKTRCLRDEPGTLQFEVLAPRDDDSSVMLYEVYRDDDAFDVHRGGASIAKWRADADGMVAKLDVTRCALVE